MKTLDYCRRFFATLFGFILFGVAGVLFKIALLPYTLKSTKGDIKRQLEARRMIGKVWRFFVGYLQWSGVLSVRFNGLEKLGRPGQLILANHPSLLDVVLLISHCSEPNVLVKKDLLNNPSMKSQIIASGYIPNDESMEMLEEIDAVFKSGQSLLLNLQPKRKASQSPFYRRFRRRLATKFERWCYCPAPALFLANLFAYFLLKVDFKISNSHFTT